MGKDANLQSTGWDWILPDWEAVEWGQPKHTVMQAVIDWREAKERLRIQPFDEDSRLIVEETESFFLSDWFEKLTTFHGEKLLNQLKEEFDA
jgi:hypothetical protein